MIYKEDYELKGLRAKENAEEISCCVSCGSVSVLYQWQTHRNKTAHIRCTCGDCGKYIKWAKQKVDVNGL